MSPRTPNRLTWPNLLTTARLVGAFVLAAIATEGDERLFVALYLGLAATDWLDGKLAILLDQRSTFGARLDTWADAALYAALLFGLILMQGPVLANEATWVAALVLSHVLSVGLSLRRFGRWPSYHTRTAKAGWLLAIIAVVCLFVWHLTWPLEIALAWAVVANIEAVLITLRLDHWRTDVGSLWRVIAERKDR